MNFFYITLVVVGLIIVILFVFTLLFAFLAYKYKRLLFPKMVLLLMSMFEWPAKAIMGKVNVDKIIVDLTNKVYEKSFKKIPNSEKIVFLPQCLRHKDCTAPLSPKGIDCKYCGMCGVAEFKKASEKAGIKTFVVPGSSFIKRTLKQHKPKAVLGVGCNIEIKEGMKMVASAGFVPQSVALVDEGCVCTNVDWEEIKKKTGI